MSEDMPDRPSNPDVRYKTSAISSALIPSCCIIYSTTPGSSWPLRVPMGSPSSAENPMVEATARPPDTAHIDAPFPRCAITTRPS